MQGREAVHVPLKGIMLACRFKEQPFPKGLPLMPTFPVTVKQGEGSGEGSHHHKVKHNQP